MRVNRLVFTVLLLLSALVFQLPAQENEADGKLLAYIRAQADKGDAEAQSDLGAIFLFGTFGVAKDYPQAIRWLRKAAEQNHPHAQSNLGACYGNALGVKRDYTQAVKWYR